MRGNASNLRTELFMNQIVQTMSLEHQLELCDGAPAVDCARFGPEASGMLIDTSAWVPSFHRDDVEWMLRGESHLYETALYRHEYGFQNNDDTDEPTGSDEPNQDDACKRAQEKCILVLDDETDIRTFVAATLGGLGYRVLEAANVNDAMRVIEEEAGKVDLLLSDVVLPGTVSGPELAAKAKDLYPELKLVFMSGYTGGLYTHGKIPGYDETLLSKPFRRVELAIAIRDALAE